MQNQINQILLQENGRISQAQPLVTILTKPLNLCEQEVGIAKVKYQAPCFAKLSDIELVGYVQGIIKRIKVITGWAIPELEEDRLILYSEMSMHFRDKWNIYNAEEVVYAIRHYSGENYGKDINLKLIDDAMARYAEVRFEISRMEEQAKNHADMENKLPPPAYNPLELVQTFYNDFLEGAANAELITARAFDIAMDKCGIVLTEKEMLKIVREARTHVVQAYEKTKQTFALDRLKALPFGESCLDEYVNRYSKALALLSWFEEQKNAGITNLIETYDMPAQKQ